METVELKMPEGPKVDHWVLKLKELQAAMRSKIMGHIGRHDVAYLSNVASDAEGDTIYEIDRSCEDVLIDFCLNLSGETSLVLIAEGIGDGGMVSLPEGRLPNEAQWLMIVDPIDGTRGIMYDKRSAWILAGLAPNKGEGATLADIEVAVQTEIPTTKQYLADTLWAVKGEGAFGERYNLLTGEARAFKPQPSRAKDIYHGFAMLSKFFPGRKEITASIEEELIYELGGTSRMDKVLVFDDQYISTGGQLYELMMGHDRFNGDMRAHLMRAPNLAGPPPGMAVHPYDLASELIAREAGVIVTDLDGGLLRAPLDVSADVSWLGYANERLRRQIEPILQRILRRYGII